MELHVQGSRPQTTDQGTRYFGEMITTEKRIEKKVTRNGQIV